MPFALVFVTGGLRVIKIPPIGECKSYEVVFAKSIVVNPALL